MIGDRRGETSAAGSTGIEETTPTALATGLIRFADKSSVTSAGALPLWAAADTPRSSPWSRILYPLAWCATLGMATLALLRVVCHDAAILLIWFNAFTLYIYLPAYAIFALALWRRRWLLAAASFLVVVCHLIWVAPDFSPATAYVPPTGSSVEASRPIRIFFANVAVRNSNHQGLIEEIADANPDVVVLAECFPEWADALRASSIIAPYKYGTNLAEAYGSDVVVLSRIPLSRQQVIVSASRLNMLVDIQIDGQPLRLFCIHSPRPLYEPANEYAEFWQRTESVLDNQPEPIVLIGDFNATQHSLVYQTLTSGRLRSAHTDRGRGYATSWPNGILPLPPIRIDQAMLSPTVECLAIREGTGAGSDHKPLILDIRVHRAGGSNSASPLPERAIKLSVRGPNISIKCCNGNALR